MPRDLIDVAVYGIINAGKSSLINALAGRQAVATGPIGGTTTEVAVEDWRDVQADIGPYAVRLVDTPGLQDLGDAGLAHEAVAAEAARKADLVLFVTAEDLTATALDAIVALREVGKPLVVALNKVDLLDPDALGTVLASVQDRLRGIIPPEDVVPTAAAPIVRERVEEPDHAARVETRRGAPQVEALAGRLVAAIAASAPDLKDLNAASAQVERHLAEREADRAGRRERAEAVADETSVALALTLAVNPVPLLDFLTGSGGLVILIRRVAEVYEAPPSAEAAQHLARELLRGGGAAFWGSMAAVGLGGALKFVPGLGHLAGALTQGAAGGYVAHILGRALVDYYENGHDWGDGGLAAALDRIAARTDRRALTRGLVERLKARLGQG